MRDPGPSHVPRRLPAEYASFGVPFGETISDGKGHEWIWEHVVRRAPDFFDVIKPDGGSKDFAKAVLSKLSSLQPRPNGTEAPKLTAVYKFRCDVLLRCLPTFAALAKQGADDEMQAAGWNH